MSLLHRHPLEGSIEATTGRPANEDPTSATGTRGGLVAFPDQRSEMAFKIGKGVQQLPFDEVLSASFLELLVEIVEAGALVSVGAARDKGALSVTVTLGGEWDREWFRHEEELLDWLREAVIVVKAQPQEPSNGSRGRKRA